MSSSEGQQQSINWRSRPLRSGSAALRRNRSQPTRSKWYGWRTLLLLGRGPKELWPYALPWLVVVLAISFGVLVALGVLSRQLLVPPVETPKVLSDRGYTSAYLADRIMSAMRKIGQDGASIPHDMISDDSEKLDIPIPGQELSYATAVHFIKGITHRTDVLVHIGIAIVDEKNESYLAHVQIENGPFNARESTLPFQGKDLDKFVDAIAVQAMRLAEPNMLANNLYSQIRKTKCHLAECDYSEIVDIYDEVLASSSHEQREWAFAGKAWLLTDLGESKAKEAERQTRDALIEFHDSAILRASLGRALAQQNRLDDALEALRAGAKEKTRTAENLRLLGDVLLRAHRNYEALDAFKQAYEMDPNSVDTLHDWGEALNSVGHYDDAIKKLSQATMLRPELAPSYAELGRALDHKGDLRGASRNYAVALKLDPGTLSAHESQLARLANAEQDGDGPESPTPNARARPVSNPRPALPFQASLEASPNAEA
jgi:tetratricopeptide (TPR) repeat protein